ncbi:MAG: hypothetical protein HY043_16580 [Verrucomicrobia bacterium]|nr:hypothetical protein [Verrucomicrobiota bacterium]
MKTFSKLTFLLVLGGSLASVAVAGHGPRPDGHAAASTNAPAVAAHAASAFAVVAPFDANSDGKLDATEQAALAKALADGTVHPFDTNAAPRLTADAATEIAAHIAGEFAVLAPFDANHDRKLDDAEQAALAQALSNGMVQFPHHGPAGPHDEMDALRQQLLATYDANGNGQLDDAEWAAIEAEVKSGKLQLPLQPTPGTRGRRGPRR